mgnify:FL=1
MPTLPDFIVNQNTGKFRHAVLLRRGWNASTYRFNGGTFKGYEKTWTVPEADGSGVPITVALKEHENIACVYVCDRFVGRALHIREAEAIVKAIKNNAQ